MNREYHKWFSHDLQREMELLVFGRSGVPLLVFENEREQAAKTALLFNSLWASFIFDYAARQKIHGAHLTKAIAYQLPVPSAASPAAHRSCG